MERKRERGAFDICEICGGEMDVVNILPIPQPNGRMDTFTCTECAHRSGVYCTKHKRPHLGFSDDTTACAICIEERVEKEGEVVGERFLQAAADLGEHLMVINEAARIASLITRQPIKMVVGRFVITTSERLKINESEVVDRFRRNGLEVIFPEP